MLRVCVIGMGPIGNLHANIYRTDPLAELVGVCDIDPMRARQAGERLGLRWFTQAEEMLHVLAPDVCSVATGGYEYASDHHAPTLLALRAGCHVLCEKPISNEIDCAEEMVRVAKEENRCFGVDFNHRFTPAARTAEKWLQEGLLGDLLFVNVALWIGRPESFESPYYHLKAVGSSRVDLQACKLEYSIVSPK